jgi:hypothetical protein
MRTALIRSAALLVFVSVLSACAARPSSRTAPAARRDVLTEQDLHDRGFTTALDAIQALRGNWLETHGTNSFYSPVTVKVYLDDTRLGGVDELTKIMVSEVVYIRHYDGIAATARWGLDHGAGAIYISTHPGLQPI